MEFVKTNLNDILAYALIVLNAILYLINNRHTKVSTTSLSSSLTTFVKNKIQDQATLVEQTVQNFSDKINQGVKEHTVTLDQKVKDAIGQFQETSFRQLADEIVTLKDTIVKNKKEAHTEALMYKEAIEEQKNVITELRQTLEATNARISELDERVRQEADANQQRYIKLKKKEA